MAGQLIGAAVSAVPGRNHVYGPSSRFDLFLGCDWTDYHPAFVALKSNARSVCLGVDFTILEHQSNSAAHRRQCYLATYGGAGALLFLRAIAEKLRDDFQQVRCAIYAERRSDDDIAQFNAGLERLGRLFGLAIESTNATGVFSYRTPDGSQQPRQFRILTAGFGARVR